MNNRETIEQVERGYRMANPAHILYPESKTHPKEVAVAQANVYKVRTFYTRMFKHRLTKIPNFNMYFSRLCLSVGRGIHLRGQHLSSLHICLRISILPVNLSTWNNPPRVDRRQVTRTMLEPGTIGITGVEQYPVSREAAVPLTGSCVKKLKISYP